MNREEELRDFFADVRDILNIKLGKFCDRNMIFRSDFSNFMKGKKYFTSISDLEQMRSDILDHVYGFLKIHQKIA